MSRLKTAILGDLAVLAADPIGFVEEHAIGARQPVPIRLGPKKALLVADPSAVRQVLIDQRDNFGKGSEQARMRPLFGDGLLTSSGERWHSTRENTRSSFSAAGLVDGLQIAMRCLTKEAGKLADRAGELMSLHSIMGQLTLRMAAASMFHVQLDDAMTENLHEAASVSFRRMSETMWRLVDIDAVFPTAKNREFHRAVKEFEGIAAFMGRDKRGILGALGPVAQKYGDRVFRDEAMTMLIAGFETTATAACWIAYVLAARPDIVAWLQPEIDASLTVEWGINANRLREMPKSRAFVHEILRLYPSAWWFARNTLADCEINGVPAKKGTSILVCPWALHRQADLWPEPLVFDPMRFFNKSPPEKFAYIPFGAGPRACIGQHVAMAELTAITAMLVSAFDLEPLSGPIEKLKPVGGVTLGPPPGMAIRMHVRPQWRKVA